MKLRLLLVALCAVLAMFTGACSSPDSPKAKPTATATPSQSQAPKMPDSAREFTEEGAEAFVRHYIDVLNATHDSGDTDALLALSTKACGNCNNFAETIGFVKTAGGHYDGGRWQVEPFKIVLGYDKTNVSTKYKVTKGSATKSPSAAPTSFTEVSGELHFELLYQAKKKSWFVNEIGTSVS